MKEQETRQEMETSNLPDKVFKEMVIKILTKLESRIQELREIFNKVLNIIKNQSELKNTVTKIIYICIYVYIHTHTYTYTH